MKVYEEVTHIFDKCSLPRSNIIDFPHFQYEIFIFQKKIQILYHKEKFKYQATHEEMKKKGKIHILLNFVIKILYISK